jgi:N-acetylglutamate synthase-like GNAT family acetyltransferase
MNTFTSVPAQSPAVLLRAAIDRDLTQITELLEAYALPTVGVAEALSGFIVAESEGAIVGVVRS